MDWTATIVIGRATAVIDGHGQAGVLDLLGEALGIAGISLISILVTFEDGVTRMMVGFSVGKDGGLQIAEIAFRTQI